MKPTQALSKSVDPDKVNALGAGALLYGWARRTKAGLESTQRHVQALKAVIDSSPSPELYRALGGDHAISYLDEALDYYEKPYTFPLLALPYRGPNNGKDSDGQYFDEMTDFMDDAIPFPPVLYTHAALNGFETDEVGDVVDRWYDSQGGWMQIALRKGPRYKQLKSAHQEGVLGGSTAPVLSVYKADENTGHIDVWLANEVSLVDMREGYAPRNRYAMAKAEQVEIVMDDYYGDPVYEDEPTFAEKLNEFINNLREFISIRRATKASIEKREDVSPESGEHKYGDVPFADETNNKYPIDTPEHIRAAWSYINQADNAAKYDADDLARIKEKIRNAAERNGIEIMAKCETCPDGLKEQADMLKAELDEMEKAEGTADSMIKCQPCQDALNWIRTVVKAGKLRVDEAYPLLESVQTMDGVNKLALIKDEIESRNVFAANPFAKAQKVAANEDVGVRILTNHTKDANSIDPEYMERLRKIAGQNMPVAKETK